MAKVKKTMRSIRCSDTLWGLVKEAASQAEMSTNEWVLTALRQGLNNGIQGEGGIDVEEASSLATAAALDTATSAALNLEASLKRATEFWAEQTEILKEETEKRNKRKSHTSKEK